MSFIGTVAENGTIVLPPEAKLAPGTQVQVQPLGRNEDHRPVGQKLAALAGSVKGMPRDLAANHDHYLHGAPKRKP